MPRFSLLRLAPAAALLATLLIALPAGSAGEAPAAPQPAPPPLPASAPAPGPVTPAPSADSDNPADLVVTIEKKAAHVQAVPRSATVLGPDALQDFGVRSVHNAAEGVPNLLMQEFTARKLSFPFMRGVGSGPNNPSVTTTIDGVPQLNANSSSQELIDLNRVEFVRGPQSALYGRNTIGGVVNLYTASPDLRTPLGRVEATFGSANLNDIRLTVGMPILANQLAFRVAAGEDARDGYTKNLATGHYLDSRDARFGRVSFLWQAAPDWQARLIFGGEHARDGDYALGDLDQIRANPHRVNHDYEGFTNRDLLGPTLVVSNANQKIQFTSTTGMLYWRTEDRTDLDTTPVDLIFRGNTESMTQWTQEFHFASAMPIELPVIGVRWQGGLYFFGSDYGQDAFNHLSALAAGGLGVPFAFNDISRSELNEAGASAYASATAIAPQLPLGPEFTFGLRYDEEAKRAHLDTSTSPAIAASTSQSLRKSFAELNPHAGITLHPVRSMAANLMAYLDFSTGFKAGGFNATAPAGNDSFDPEHTWTYELGVKSQSFENRLTCNADVFYLNWSDMQLDVPNILIPGRFFVANVGQAMSRGAEIEITARPLRSWELFFSAGYLDAKFLAGSMASGASVGGNFLPYAPSATGRIGFQYTAQVEEDFALFLRADADYIGRYFYDASNKAKQTAYGLVNLRGGFRTSHCSLSVYAKNLFNTEYVPLAFPFQPAFAPSGYVGEFGAPATYGVTLQLDM